MQSFARKAIAASVTAVLMSTSAHAVLQRSGPVATGGFPAWYQDTAGNTLELCLPGNQTDLANGICLILPADVPNGTAPESAPADLTTPGTPFPNWAVEHFYYMLQADPASTVSTVTCHNVQSVLTCTPGTGPLVYRNAIEASFNGGAPVTGEQITFNRWRVDHPGVPCDGSYTIVTPFKTKIYPNLRRGDPIKDTEDIGIGPNFDGALAGSVGPFAFPAATSGGARLPLVTGADGKTYLSDGGALSAITGAPSNVLTFTGPGAVSGVCGAPETYRQSQFQVVGRVFQGAVGPRLAVEKATYKAVGGRYQIGVFGKAMQEANATGAPNVTVNLTGAPGVAASGSLLAKTFPMPQATPVVTGQIVTTEHEFFLGNNADLVVAGVATPKWDKALVTVGDPVNAKLTQQVTVPLVDEVTVGNVVFNSTARTLTIPATSGATLKSATVVATATQPGVCSVPCLKVGGAGLPAGTNLEIPVTTVGATSPSGTLVISGVDVPPAFVTVSSTLGGSDTVPVQYIGAAANTVLIQNDNITTIKNAPEVVADVTANDIGYRIDPVTSVVPLTVCTSSASTISATAGVGVTATTAGTCTAATTPTVPPATCTVNNARATTAGCTPLGGKVWRVGNELRYAPPANTSGTDMFWYQVGTNQTATSTARALVTVKIFDAGVGPQVIGDSAFAVAGKPVDLNVLANDVSPLGINPNSVQFTAGWEPQLVVAPGAAPVLAPTTAYAILPNSQVRFTPPSTGQWIFRYTFKDTQGTTAASGAVVVNAVAAEGIAVTGARATIRTNQLAVTGTITPVNGSTPPTVTAPVLRMKVVPTGGFCAANPTIPLNAADPSALVTAAGTYDFGALPFATSATETRWVVVYDADWGGCGEAQIVAR